MIDLNYANKNINQYKKDYRGYQVIVDKITTNHILNENNLTKERNQLNLLINTYQKELNLILLKENNNLQLFHDAFNLPKEKVIENLKYISSRLSAIGYILIGKGKEIGL